MNSVNMRMSEQNDNSEELIRFVHFVWYTGPFILASSAAVYGDVTQRSPHIGSFQTNVLYAVTKFLYMLKKKINLKKISLKFYCRLQPSRTNIIKTLNFGVEICCTDVKFFLK